MHSPCWHCMHIGRLQNVFWYMYTHTFALLSGDKPTKHIYFIQKPSTSHLYRILIKNVKVTHWEMRCLKNKIMCYTWQVLQRYEVWGSTKSFVVQVALWGKETQAALSEPLSTWVSSPTGWLRSGCQRAVRLIELGIFCRPALPSSSSNEWSQHLPITFQWGGNTTGKIQNRCMDNNSALGKALGSQSNSGIDQKNAEIQSELA